MTVPLCKIPYYGTLTTVSFKLTMKRLTILLILLSIATVVFSQPYKRRVTLNPNSGYINYNELTSGYGLGETEIDYSKYFYGLTTTHGYELNIYGLGVNSSLAISGGAGILFYNGGALFPLYGDLRFTSKKKRISPFVFSRSGLLINTSDFNMGTRVFINAGAGASYKINDQLEISFCPGLYVQMGNNVYRDAFVDIKAGVVFRP